MLVFTNRESHRGGGFRLVPKVLTLNDLKPRTYVKLNEARLAASATKMQPRDSSFFALSEYNSGSRTRASLVIFPQTDPPHLLTIPVVQH